MKEIEHGKVLVINENECRQLITDEKALELTEQALADFSNGIAINPIKLHLPLFPENNGWINSMPSWLKRQNVTGMKWVNVHGDNMKHKLPTVVGTIILNDPATGIPFAIVDGTLVTALRTGAVAGIMAKYCSRKNAKVLTIVGAGVQGNTAMVMTGLSIPHLEEVRVVDLRPEAVEKLIAHGKERFPKLKFVAGKDLQTAITGSDIIICAAHGSSGLFDNINFDKGAAIIGISGGFSSPMLRKKCDRVIMDYIDCVVHRRNQAGKYMQELYGQPFNPISRDVADGEIGDVITGKIPGRMNDEQIVHASGVGMSVEDISVAFEIFERAKEKDMGTLVQLFNTL